MHTSIACAYLHTCLYMQVHRQAGGDILHVPLHWGHATLNVETTVGITYEFNYLS